MTSLEFRVPISPTPGFFSQTRLFRFALDRLGGRYRDALLTIVIGDNADIGAVAAANPWSRGRNVRWVGVPHAVFGEFGIHGTADYRYLPAPVADVTIISDADTALVAPIDDLLDRIDKNAAELYGHMAHYPPTDIDEHFAIKGADGAFWGPLLSHFGIAAAQAAHRYSMDADGAHGFSPPYFNLGFLAMTAPALSAFGAEIFAVQRELLRVFPSHMRCQFAVTIIGLKRCARVEPVSAIYNLANDDAHLRANRVTPDAARVIHYLRETEFSRPTFLLPEAIGETLARVYKNAVTRRLMALVRDYKDACDLGEA
jgi:hypothetical protein